MIDESRLRRYREKILHIERRISQIEEWTLNYTDEDFIRDEKTKLAVYKAFQEIVESIMDIIAMMCKDMGIPPKDDYTNIETIGNLGIINRELSEKLIEANGLRNRLVHHYNKLDDKIAFESIKELLEPILKFVGVVEDWIMKKLEK